MASNKEAVILLHGLARSSRSMAKIAKSLSNEGYNIINVSYPSRQHPIEKLAEDAIGQALGQCEKQQKVHFVTHSMGGILVRQYLATHTIANLGRTVMIAPPNRGSHIVDRIGHWALFRWINGLAGSQLGSDNQSVPTKLGPVNFDLGIIAGNRCFNPFLSFLLPSPHDGKVTAENTKVEGMTGHITLALTHTFMANNRRVINSVITFLKQGQFG